MLVANAHRGSDPARCCRAAIFRAGFEFDGRSWRGTMDGIDHRFKQNQPTGWQAEARANHDAVVDAAGQAAFNRRDRRLVGADKAVLGMPAPRCEIGQREFDPSVDLFCGHAWRQRWIRKVHCRRIKTDQHYAFHRPSMTRIIASTGHSPTSFFALRYTTRVRGISLKCHGSTRGLRQPSPRRLRHEWRTLATSTLPTPE